MSLLTLFCQVNKQTHDIKQISFFQTKMMQRVFSGLMVGDSEFISADEGRLGGRTEMQAWVQVCRRSQTRAAAAPIRHASFTLGLF